MGLFVPKDDTQKSDALKKSEPGRWGLLGFQGSGVERSGLQGLIKLHNGLSGS